jgi:hypothetical protein
MVKAQTVDASRANLQAQNLREDNARLKDLLTSMVEIQQEDIE